MKKVFLDVIKWWISDLKSLKCNDICMICLQILLFSLKYRWKYDIYFVMYLTIFNYCYLLTYHCYFISVQKYWNLIKHGMKSNYHKCFSTNCIYLILSIYAVFICKLFKQIYFSLNLTKSSFVILFCTIRDRNVIHNICL